MPSRRRRIPKYRHYKPKNLAVVRIDGHDHYLGRYDSPDSWERYHRLIAEWLHNGQQLPTPNLGGSCSGGTGVLVKEVILRYWQYAGEYYRKNGQPTGEIENIRTALRPLRKLYGNIPAGEFGPDALEVVRSTMIKSGLSRNVVNARVSRIRRMFQWSSSKRLVPPETYHGLLAVKGLQRGRYVVRDTEAVRPVSDEHVAAVLPKVNPVVRGMIQVQELAGMRPQDIRNMRTCDLDMTHDVWVYEPWTHKNEHRGQLRRIAIGPRAQAILRPFLKPDDPEAYMFSPREAVQLVQAERRRNRRTPLTPSQRARKPKTKPKRRPGDQYSRTSYQYAISRACRKVGIPAWGPNRLRHNCATKVRKKYGIEAAAAVLGNSLGMVAEVYAETVFEKAVQIMREIG